MAVRVVLGVCGFLLVGCGIFPEREAPVIAEGEVRGGVSSEVLVRPQARPDAVAPAVAVPAVSEVSTGTLGRTVASLGDASQPGLWLKTPLVQSERPGRLYNPANDRSVAVTLIPIEGPVTAGSRLSLQAMQDLGAPLTGLPEIDVFAS